MVQFTATVEAGGRRGHAVHVPDEVALELGVKHLMGVKGCLAGAPYRSNLVKMGRAALPRRPQRHARRGRQGHG